MHTPQMPTGQMMQMGQRPAGQMMQAGQMDAGQMHSPHQPHANDVAEAYQQSHQHLGHNHTQPVVVAGHGQMLHQQHAAFSPVYAPGYAGQGQFTRRSFMRL